MATGVLDLLMKKWFNKLAHVTIGAWVAGGVNDPCFRHGAYAVGAAFLAYQVVEAWRKGDMGYGELKEFGIGMALPLIWGRPKGWLHDT